jgi:hypothetical protein
VRVRGATRIEARVAPRTGGVVVEGSLRDDVGAPIPNAHVSITFATAASNSTGPAVPLPLPRPQTCRGWRTAHPPHLAPDEYVVDTDERGAFCIETPLGTEGPARPKEVAATFRYGGSPLYDPTQAEVAVDLGSPAVSLTFDPQPRTISLDEDTFSLGVRLASGWFPRDGAHLVVRDERGARLGTAAVDPSGLAHLDIATKDLAGPGRGELRVDVEGTLPVAPPTLVASIERHARVQVVPRAATATGVAEDGIPVEVAVRWARGIVPSGALEARLADHGEPVGGGTVRDGLGQVVLAFAPDGAERAKAVLRFLPDAPWWEGGHDAAVELVLEPPSAWRRAPWLLFAVAMGSFALRGWWQPGVRRLSRSKGAPREPVSPGPIREVRPLPRNQGWRGRVVDAHEGRPVPDAEIAILVPVFPGASGGAPREGVVAKTRTDDEGRFTLSEARLAEGARLHVRATWHAKLDQPCPPSGEIVVAMVSRRRALLDRLVSWSKSQLGPWTKRADPTPEEVAARARQKQRTDARAEHRAAEVSAWAKAVETAAYGPKPIDEEAERTVTALEPESHG